MIKELKQALSQDGPSPEGYEKITQLGPYRLVSHAGDGGQGSVFEARNEIDRKFAIKFEPGQSRGRGEDSSEDPQVWLKEINALLKFQHRCIVRIFTAGVASYETKQGWRLSTLSECVIDDNSEVYIVMEFIESSLAQAFSGVNTDDTNVASLYADRYDKLILDTCSAIEACHQSRITHGDLSANNIRYSPEDETFVITDFGYSESQSHRRASHPAEIPGLNPFQHDILRLSQILLDTLELVRTCMEPWKSNGVQSTIQKVLAHPSSLIDIAAFRQNLSPFLRVTGWSLNLQLGQSLIPSARAEFRWNSIVRIPHSGSILLCPAVKEIIDTPVFQRLRLVKQLGPTSHVFPGATHTRFEHSLGVYHLCCLYLQRLSQLEVFRASIDDLDHDIRLTVAAALLHDVGHYPGLLSLGRGTREIFG